jgi:hypothetical protein
MILKLKRVRFSFLIAISAYALLSSILYFTAFSGPNAHLLIEMALSEKGMAQIDFVPSSGLHTFDLHPFFLKGSLKTHTLAFLIPSKQPLIYRFYPVENTGPVPVTGTISRVWVRSRWLHRIVEIPLENVHPVAGIESTFRSDDGLEFELSRSTRYPSFDIRPPFSSTNNLQFFPTNNRTQTLVFVLVQIGVFIAFLTVRMRSRTKPNHGYSEHNA